MLLILFVPLFACSQKAGFITVNQLLERVNKGKDTTYVINFWATWCVPCLKEIPHFEALHAQYEKEKLKVLLINVDFKSKRSTAVLPFVKKKNLQSEVFVLDEENGQAFIDRIDTTWSGAIPATLFIKGPKRRFFEGDFTYPELVTACKNFNNL